MKLSIFAIDFPLPANSGARIDICRRLEALTADGFQIQLFAWAEAIPADLPVKLEGFCEQVVYLQFRTDFSAKSSTSKLHKLRVAARKLFSFTPALCQAFALDQAQRQRVIAQLKAFSPDALVIDGLQCSHAVFQILNDWQQPSPPVYYRSHNREFKYNFDLARNLHSFASKAQFYSDALRLLYYEPYIFLRSAATLQISHQDYVFWNRLKIGRQAWLPPVAESMEAREEVVPLYDIVILSGWSESQKAAGLLWFLQEVKPLLPGDLTIAVAGRGATPELAERCRQSGCIFLGQVPDPHLVLAQGKVLINAVFGGSGFYMKMLDMIRAGRPIVATKDGVIGMALPPAGLVRIANTPAEFSRALLDALSSKEDRREEVAAYLQQYSSAQCARQFRQILAQEHEGSSQSGIKVA